MVRNSDEKLDLTKLAGGAIDPDAQCMVRVRQGSVAAFEQLLDRYQVPVRSYLANRLCDRDGAEDLTQEVFLRVFRARGSYVPRSKFSTWLFTIVNNVATNAHRRRRTRREFLVAYEWQVEDAAEQDAVAHPELREWPLERLERSEARQAVRQAMRTLNERQRRAIRLCKIQGLSYADVAREMNITTKAVKSLLNRAKANLREALLEYMEEAEDVETA